MAPHRTDFFCCVSITAGSPSGGMGDLLRSTDDNSTADAESDDFQRRNGGSTEELYATPDLCSLVVSPCWPLLVSSPPSPPLLVDNNPPAITLRTKMLTYALHDYSFQSNADDRFFKHSCAMPTVPAQSSERLHKIIVQIQSPLHSSGL